MTFSTTVAVIIGIVVVLVAIGGVGIALAQRLHGSSRKLLKTTTANKPEIEGRKLSEEDPETIMVELADKALSRQLLLKEREAHQAENGRYLALQPETPTEMGKRIEISSDTGCASLTRPHARSAYLTEPPAPDASYKESSLAPSQHDEKTTLDDEKTPDSSDTPDTVPPVHDSEDVSRRMVRLRSRLARSGSFGRALLMVFGKGDLTSADWEEIEDSLVMSDLGLQAVEELMKELRTQVKISGTHDINAVKEVLYHKLRELLEPDMDRELHTKRPCDDLPAVFLTVGVNGTGKTTTIGKIARLLVCEKHHVLLGAADTFRAAAGEQLETWGNRVGADTIRSQREGADPASVAFEAVDEGIKRHSDVVLVDTAGRLHNKATLMDELGKIKRVIEKKAPIAETLLVLDATTGQNGLQQARVFADVVDITGIVLTKLDGSAKGGIVVRVQQELRVPVKLVGLGEGLDDLAPFDPDIFAHALIYGNEK